MSESKISCPHCTQHVLVDDAWAGQTVNCPSCQQAFVVPRAAPTAQFVPPPPAPASRISTPPSPPPAQTSSAPRPQVTASPGTSGVAVTAFVLSLLGCFGLFAIAGVVCGHIARGQMRRNPALGGRGLATAALIIGYLFIALNVALGVKFVLDVGKRVNELQARRAGSVRPAQTSPGSGQSSSAPRGIDTNPIIKSDVPVPDGAVTGKIQAQPFTYSRAAINKFMGMLTVDQGDHFHPDQQLKIVSLVRPGSSIENRTWTVTPSGAGIKPTVWLTWVQNGQSHTDAPQYYSLEIKTGPETNGIITGTLSFSCTGRTVASLKGNFAAKVE